VTYFTNLLTKSSYKPEKDKYTRQPDLENYFFKKVLSTFSKKQFTLNQA